jgi:hypothetical protein
MADALSGLTCYACTDRPPHVRVTWIAWNSPFRATELRTGDRIIAVNGAPVSDEMILKNASNLPGFYGETPAFAVSGLDVGSALTLTVRRRAVPHSWTELTVTAPLMGRPQTVQNAEGRTLIAPGGPDLYDSAGFYTGGWSGWYDNMVKKFSQIADTDQQHGGSTWGTRFEWNDLGEQHGARVDLAVEKFPCDWSRALKTDYDDARAATQGEAIVLPAGALDYRRRGEQLAAEVRAKGVAAFDVLKAANAADTIAAFPAPNPVRDDISAVIGKIVLLPPLGNRDYVMDGGRTLFAAGSDGWYFIDAEGEAAQAMLVAQRRYEKLVDPMLPAQWQFLARITGDSRLAVIADRAHFGLVVEPLAALVGGSMCVDLAQRHGIQIGFTGEAGLIDDTPDLPPDDATPAQVMAALIGAVKAGDMALWQALHVDWWVEDRGDGRLIVHPRAAPPDTNRWDDQRRAVLKEVIDARTTWIDDPVILAPADRFPGAEAIEQVTLWQDHIADFGTPDAPDVRSYTAASVTATWTLQRIGKGPWRVVQASRI